jgi:hypothetical protein
MFKNCHDNKKNQEKWNTKCREANQTDSYPSNGFRDFQRDTIYQPQNRTEFFSYHKYAGRRYRPGNMKHYPG